MSDWQDQIFPNGLASLWLLECVAEAYKVAAEEAASVERSGNYAKASELWAIAEKQAVTLAQREWCNTRRWYCKTWQGKRERKQ